MICRSRKKQNIETQSTHYTAQLANQSTARKETKIQIYCLDPRIQNLQDPGSDRPLESFTSSIKTNMNAIRAQLDVFSAFVLLCLQTMVQFVAQIRVASWSLVSREVYEPILDYERNAIQDGQVVYVSTAVPMWAVTSSASRHDEESDEESDGDDDEDDEHSTPDISIPHQDKIQAIISKLPPSAPLITIAINGAARAGKSTTMNYLVGWLLKNAFKQPVPEAQVRSIDEEEIVDFTKCITTGARVPVLFKTSDGMRPCTKGADGVFVHLPAGAFGHAEPQVVLLIDCEGSGDETKEHDARTVLPALVLSARGALIIA